MLLVVVVQFGVTILDKLMLPLPLLKEVDVVPVTALAPVILPEPVAVKVTVVPERAPLTTIGLFVPVSVNSTGRASHNNCSSGYNTRSKYVTGASCG